MVGKIVGNRHVIRQKRRIISVYPNTKVIEFNGLSGFSSDEAGLFFTSDRISFTRRICLLSSSYVLNREELS